MHLAHTEELCLTTVCWMNPSVDLHHDDAALLQQQPSTSTITTSRPLGNHEDHGTVSVPEALHGPVLLGWLGLLIC